MPEKTKDLLATLRKTAENTDVSCPAGDAISTRGPLTGEEPPPRPDRPWPIRGEEPPPRPDRPWPIRGEEPPPRPDRPWPIRGEEPSPRPDRPRPTVIVSRD